MDMLNVLQNLILERKNFPKSKSYTSHLFNEKGLVERKINEEAYELIEASLNNEKEAVIEEAADLFYHILVMLSKQNVYLEDIYNSLRKRRK